MAKHLMSITVRGKEHTWGFNFYGDTRYWQEWVADGLEVYAVENVIPEWWVRWGFSVRLWCFVQDLLHFKNPRA